ncbi:MAG TPA: DUF2971 domain-containing protein, partial [Rudaea sp.]|uniref:DUF2971 domain-containing protein n=1 Tax=Rudaea sp. TaxID=2136325 RepID=UPI002F9591E1
QELHHARTIIVEEAKGFAANHEFGSAVANRVLSSHVIPDVYVFSTSLERKIDNGWDDLSQWRAYGNYGSGVALAFQFIGAGPPLPPGLAFGKVLYDETAKRHFVTQVLQLGFASSNTNLQAAIDATALELARFIPLMKHQAFAEEREIRFVFVPQETGGPEEKFYSRGSMVVPYVSLNEIYDRSGTPRHELPFWPLQLQRIAIGPSSSNLAINTLRLALAKSPLRTFHHFYGHAEGNVELLPSSIPYRELR